MHWIWTFIVSHRYITSLCITSVLSLSMILAPREQQERIAQKLMMTVFLPAQLVVSSTYKIENCFRENKIMRDDLARLQVENAALRSTQEKIIHPQSSNYEWALVSAQVVAREPSFLYRTVVINVGEQDGIRMHMPVVTIDGVAGKVITVLKSSSLVQLLREPDEYVSVIHEESGAMGILSSRSDGLLYVDVRTDREVAEGDTIRTSGFGGIYPEGLPVGVVERIDYDMEQQIFKRLYVQSVVNYDNLRDVFVIALEPQWSAFQNEIKDLLRTGQGQK